MFSGNGGPFGPHNWIPMDGGIGGLGGFPYQFGAAQGQQNAAISNADYARMQAQQQQYVNVLDDYPSYGGLLGSVPTTESMETPRAPEPLCSYDPERANGWMCTTPDEFVESLSRIVWRAVAWLGSLAAVPLIVWAARAVWWAL